MGSNKLTARFTKLNYCFTAATFSVIIWQKAVWSLYMLVKVNPHNGDLILSVHAYNILTDREHLCSDRYPWTLSRDHVKMLTFPHFNRKVRLTWAKCRCSGVQSTECTEQSTLFPSLSSISIHLKRKLPKHASFYLLILWFPWIIEFLFLFRMSRFIKTLIIEQSTHLYC